MSSKTDPTSAENSSAEVFVPAATPGPDSPGDFPDDLPDDFPGDFPGDFPDDFPGDLPGDFPGSSSVFHAGAAAAPFSSRAVHPSSPKGCMLFIPRQASAGVVPEAPEPSREPVPASGTDAGNPCDISAIVPDTGSGGCSAPSRNILAPPAGSSPRSGKTAEQPGQTPPVFREHPGIFRKKTVQHGPGTSVVQSFPAPAEYAPAFEQFALGVYPFLELQPFHRAYYRVLEAFAAGRIRRLIVTMPPQHGKSVGATTLLPAYALGLDPDLRVAIASYSGTLASKFNRRVQRILESREYAGFFPATNIKCGAKPSGYIRTADEVEIVGRRGSLLSVGREGSLTGNRVDCFILDDLYKDALEANSPLIRANCWEWYVSVVRTRMHNASRELIVFTRWHEEDLIGTLAAREPVIGLADWTQLDDLPADTWLYLNFEALKASPPTGIDPRTPGEALWEAQQGRALLEAKRRLDPLQFESMYQGHPSSREGLLYGANFAEYDDLPHEIVRRANYTDTADTGDDYLCSLSYAVDADGVVYVTDAVYSREPMEVTEPLVADMLLRSGTRQAVVESNNGGRGFARSVQALAPGVRIEWFHQGGNKEARILSNSATALHMVRFPRGWNLHWPELYAHLTTYRRRFRTNRWHDAADVVTGIVEREAAGQARGRVRGVRFL